MRLREFVPVRVLLRVTAQLLLMPTAVLLAQVVVPPRPLAGGPGSGPSTADANKYIVRFQAGTSPASRAASIQRAGGVVRYNYTTLDAAAITVPNANVLAALRQDRSVLEIVPDRRIRAWQKGGGGGKPGGGGGSGGQPLPGGSQQILPYGVQRVGFPTAASHGEGVGAAVVDSGIDLSHTDLTISGSKFDAFGGVCQDGFGHGTHVSGIIAAKDNQQDVVGVAPKATLYCVKVLDNVGNGTDSTAIAGLEWILLNHSSVMPPIRVVNISWGRPYEAGETLNPPGPLRQAIQNLYNAGIVVVAAAGNDPTVEVSALVPSGYPEVLAVAATTGDLSGADCAPGVPRDSATFFTTDGKFDTGTHIGVTTSAPGDEREASLTFGGFYCLLVYDGILSTRLGGGISRQLAGSEAAGTSFAAPHVVGVIARMIQFIPLNPLSGADVEDIRNRIRSRADRVNLAPLDHPWGGLYITYTYDLEREGIAQAPR